MADLNEYIELLDKLKGGKVVVPQSREEAFRLAFLNAMSGESGGDIMDQLEEYMKIYWGSVSTLPYDFYDSAAVVYNNEIHILGSYEGSYQTAHYK